MNFCRRVPDSIPEVVSAGSSEFHIFHRFSGIGSDSKFSGTLDNWQTTKIVKFFNFSDTGDLGHVFRNMYGM